MTYEFDAELWEWSARVDRWTFVSLPPATADDLLERGAAVARGFGSLRVDVTIGGTTWRTSVFPSDSAGTFVLPVKRAVRAAESLETGDRVHVLLSLVDA